MFTLAGILWGYVSSEIVGHYTQIFSVEWWVLCLSLSSVLNLPLWLYLFDVK